MVSSISAWVSAEPPTSRHCSPVLRRWWLSWPSRPNPMIAARSRRGLPSGCVVIVISRRAFREGLPKRGGASGRGASLPRPPVSPRDSYRLPDRDRTAPRGGFAAECEARSATFLRPAQAFLGGRSRHPVGRPDRDRPGLDLLLAEEPRPRSWAGPPGRSSAATGRGTGDTLLKIVLGIRLFGHVVGSCAMIPRIPPAQDPGPTPAGSTPPRAGLRQAPP